MLAVDQRSPLSRSTTSDPHRLALATVLVAGRLVAEAEFRAVDTGAAVLQTAKVDVEVVEAVEDLSVAAEEMIEHAEAVEDVVLSGAALVKALLQPRLEPSRRTKG
jgi:hypothetical protein